MGWYTTHPLCAKLDQKEVRQTFKLKKLNDWVSKKAAIELSLPTIPAIRNPRKINGCLVLELEGEVFQGKISTLPQELRFGSRAVLFKALGKGRPITRARRKVDLGHLQNPGDKRWLKGGLCLLSTSPSRPGYGKADLKVRWKKGASLEVIAPSLTVKKTSIKKRRGKKGKGKKGKKHRDKKSKTRKTKEVASAPKGDCVPVRGPVELAIGDCQGWVRLAPAKGSPPIRVMVQFKCNGPWWAYLVVLLAVAGIAGIIVALRMRYPPVARMLVLRDPETGQLLEPFQDCTSRFRQPVAILPLSQFGQDEEGTLSLKVERNGTILCTLPDGAELQSAGVSRVGEWQLGSVEPKGRINSPRPLGLRPDGKTPWMILQNMDTELET